MHSSSRTMRVNDIVKLNPFHGQRDVDRHRIATIAEHYAKQYDAHGNVRIINPFVIVEGQSIGVELLDNTNNRVMKAICDGQHRIGALRVLLQRFPSLGNLELDVYVNEVHTMQEAYDIQRELFQQKPVDLYDQTENHQNNNLQSVLSEFQVHLRALYPNAGSVLRRGRYGGKNGHQRMHLMTEELEYHIKNSPNVNRWLCESITAERFTDAFKDIIQKCKEGYHRSEHNTFAQTLTSNQKAMLQSRSEKNGDIVYLNFFYYKKYAMLVQELESELNIVEPDV